MSNAAAEYSSVGATRDWESLHGSWVELPPLTYQPGLITDGEISALLAQSSSLSTYTPLDQSDLSWSSKCNNYPQSSWFVTALSCRIVFTSLPLTSNFKCVMMGPKSVTIPCTPPDHQDGILQTRSLLLAFPWQSGKLSFLSTYDLFAYIVKCQANQTVNKPPSLNIPAFELKCGWSHSTNI